MSDWPVGLSTGCFYRTSILECLEPIRNSGFGLIEICSFPAHLDYHNLDAVHAARRRIGIECRYGARPFKRGSGKAAGNVRPESHPGGGQTALLDGHRSRAGHGPKRPFWRPLCRG